MAEFFKMPKLGMDMEEGSIVKWLKAEGDAVEKGEALAEIETDKACVEVESPAGGVVLKYLYAEGESLPCGTPIAVIGQAGEALPPIPGGPEAVSAPEQTPVPETPAPAAPAPAASATTVSVPAAPVSVTAAGPGEKRRSSPRARRLAEQNQVDLSRVSGTGPAGRIIERDVRAYLAQGSSRSSPVRRRTETVAPLKGIRKITAARMRQSLSEMAQTNHRMDVDMSSLIAFRRQLNARLEKDGVKVSFVTLLTAVCAKALTDYPMANASLREDGLHTMNYVNIGIAVATDRGLVVPVIQDADILTIPELVQRERDLIDKARRGALQPDEMSGGTFTISNLGMYGVDSFTAIVNPPETCILAVGQIADRVVAENGQPVVRPMMTLSLSYDHRVLDGAPAAEFLQAIKRYMENPVWLLLP
jgi:pyruvate dehydrogenase E2 component (dihydrolipoamide acetyltransferase)